MFQVGEKVHWENEPHLVGTVLESDQTTSVVDWGPHGIMKKNNSRIRRVSGVKEITITIDPPKHGWKDVSDISELRRNDVEAYAAYASDGSCWEWTVLHAAGPGFIQSGKGRSIDRRTAKSDAEFFINNYKPEDTSERDELRAKLERSWHK